MGIKCPKCKKTNTESHTPGKMWCKFCSYEWKPSTVRGKKYKKWGNILIGEKRYLPSAKTQTEYGILGGKRRVKKPKKKKGLLDF